MAMHCEVGRISLLFLFLFLLTVLDPPMLALRLIDGLIMVAVFERSQVEKGS